MSIQQVGLQEGYRTNGWVGIDTKGVGTEWVRNGNGIKEWVVKRMDIYKRMDKNEWITNEWVWNGIKEWIYWYNKGTDISTNEWITNEWVWNGIKEWIGITNETDISTNEWIYTEEQV